MFFCSNTPSSCPSIQFTNFCILDFSELLLLLIWSYVMLLKNSSFSSSLLTVLLPSIRAVCTAVYTALCILLSRQRLYFSSQNKQNLGWNAAELTFLVYWEGPNLPVLHLLEYRYRRPLNLTSSKFMMVATTGGRRQDGIQPAIPSYVLSKWELTTRYYSHKLQKCYVISLKLNLV